MSIYCIWHFGFHFSYQYLMNFVIFNNCELAVITFDRYLEGTHLLFRDQNVAHWLDVLALPLVTIVCYGWGEAHLQSCTTCVHMCKERTHMRVVSAHIANTLSVKPCPCRVFEPMFEFLNVSLKSKTCMCRFDHTNMFKFSNVHFKS